MSKEIFKPTAVTLYVVKRFYFAKMKKQKKNDLHIPDPVLLHIFSYQHGSLCNLVQKKLSKYADEDYVFGTTKMPISLILSSDLLMEFQYNKDILITKMKIPESFTANWVNPSIISVAARHNNLQAMKWLESNILHAANTAKKKKSYGRKEHQ